MIKIGGAGGYGTEFIIDSEIMTDNLILSQKDVSLMLMVSDYFLYLTAHTSIITTVLTERQ
jgi:hypothetical protein